MESVKENEEANMSHPLLAGRTLTVEVAKAGATPRRHEPISRARIEAKSLTAEFAQEFGLRNDTGVGDDRH